MTNTNTPAPAAKPDGLNTCLTTAMTAAKDLLGDNNSSVDAIVKLTTAVVKDGKSQSATYQASVGLARHVDAFVDVPSAAPNC
jgi:hypothetical protein